MLFLTLKSVSSISKFSYNVVICNSHNKAIRKIGKFFYSNIFKRFVLRVDFVLLYLLFRKGVKIDQFFFFVFSKFLNFGVEKYTHGLLKSLCIFYNKKLNF